MPVVAHTLAEPDKGTGIAMICTFGDVTDVTWWRELQLPTRALVGRDGRLARETPPWLAAEPAAAAYAELAGATVHGARTRIVELLRDAGALDGDPRPISHPVKFYEKGDRPLEIVTSRQWYLRNGGRDGALRDALLERGQELAWHPAYMRHRFENWVGGLNGDWLVSRQRFFGVPFPVWYPLDDEGRPVHDAPILAAEESLPVDPTSQCPPGFDEDRRDVPGGFTADPDIMDTWATSSLTPQIAGGWERDEDLFGRVYPMDLRPQAHDIIRTWLFSTVLRAHLEQGVLPWKHAALSGWILDPDRKKMSKSRGNVVTPMDLLVEYGSDGVRYWAASGRPGADTAFDPAQMKVGRRLAIKILNASKFLAGITAAGGREATGGHETTATRDGEALPMPTVALEADLVSDPLDRAVLAALAEVVEQATAALDDYEYTRALEVTESFFWTFCDDYLELVKDRAYGGRGEAAAASARVTLSTCLDVLLRLFAPFLPFATEEVWSWTREGSVHRASWPVATELRTAAAEGDPAVLEAASVVLSRIRRAKSQAKLSMRMEVASARVHGPDEDVARVRLAADDLAAAGRVLRLWFSSDSGAAGKPGAGLPVVAEGEPVAKGEPVAAPTGEQAAADAADDGRLTVLVTL